MRASRDQFDRQSKRTVGLPIFEIHYEEYRGPQRTSKYAKIRYPAKTKIDAKSLLAANTGALGRLTIISCKKV